jgi:hypothetical protein
LKFDKLKRQPSGAGDLHVYDIKPLRDGRFPDGSQLTPTAVLPLGANVPWMSGSNDRLRLYCLKTEAKDGGSARMIRIDTATNRVDAQLELPRDTEVVCMTPDGSALYAVVATRRTAAPNGSKHGEGLLWDIDPKLFKVTRRMPIPLNPLDVQATDAKLVLVSGGSANSSDGIIAVVDMKDTQAVLTQWRSVSRGTRIRLSGDQKWLFLSPSTFPATIEAWRIPESPSEVPSVKEFLRDPPGIPLGGDLFLTPGGEYLLTRSGGVVPICVVKDTR